jgi:hypothetical protein
MVLGNSLACSATPHTTIRRPDSGLASALLAEKGIVSTRTSHPRSASASDQRLLTQALAGHSAMPPRGKRNARLWIAGMATVAGMVWGPD